MKKFNKNNSKDLMTLLLVVAMSFLIVFGMDMRKHEKYSDFNTLLNENKIQEVTFKGDTITYILKGTEKEYKVISVGDNENLVQKLEAKDIPFTRIPASKVSSFALSLLPTIIMIAAMSWLLGSFGRKQGGKVKPIKPEQNDITFDQIAGHDDILKNVREVVDMFKNVDKYREMGVEPPKGILLEGPTGTGKTMLAKAIANESGGIPFLAVNGSDFVEMYVGVGAKRVRELFAQAALHKKSIIFIDEIDIVGAKRSDDGGSGSKSENEQTLTQLLVEIDGFAKDHDVLIIGTTNRPEAIDPALLRAGRFDRRIVLNAPDQKGRMDLFKVYMKDKPLKTDINIKRLASLTSGATGADIRSIINRAISIAIFNGETQLSQSNLIKAIEEVATGVEKKASILSASDKKIIAHHEAGHAIVGSILKGPKSISKITIIPRTSGSLGYVMYSDDDESSLLSSEEILAKIITLYAGRAAEEVFLTDVTSGASNDFEVATRYIRRYVETFGMGSSIGKLSIRSESGFLGNTKGTLFSDRTMDSLDQEMKHISDACYNLALEFVNDNKSAIIDLANKLLEIETIDDIEFGKFFTSQGLEVYEGDLRATIQNFELTNSRIASPVKEVKVPYEVVKEVIKEVEVIKEIKVPYEVVKEVVKEVIVYKEPESIEGKINNELTKETVASPVEDKVEEAVIETPQEELTVVEDNVIVDNNVKPEALNEHVEASEEVKEESFDFDKPLFDQISMPGEQTLVEPAETVEETSTPEVEFDLDSLFNKADNSFGMMLEEEEDSYDPDLYD